MQIENNKMVELSDEELLDMVGGYSSNLVPIASSLPVLLYGVKPSISIIKDIINIIK
ncbi:hypothetical protein EHE19_004665 [Ruminiclostridium herbifermentans]|uniref:Uncharacterized protein n=1 Tax=Ruminiclostridium herbifermentans TaxID=2488810 RepID=A0A7H1VQU9_9FIRM|nr:hypothetical protein [Ruminiclostridium herbifermentans]QNU67761.1 hypothetical protein EHE19_004665 [Ruminiclostridium herbifermentans]